MAARAFPTGRVLNRRAIARAVLALAAGMLIIAAAVSLAVGLAGTRKSGAGLTIAPALVSAERSRCDALESAADGDARCRTLWAQDARRFFGDSTAAVPPSKDGRP